MNTFGPCYVEAIDGKIVRTQMQNIKNLMLDGEWRTFAEIAASIGCPETSASAQLRHLRKARFGGFIVDRRMRGCTRTREYRVSQI